MVVVESGSGRKGLVMKRRNIVCREVMKLGAWGAREIDQWSCGS